MDIGERGREWRMENFPRMKEKKMERGVDEGEGPIVPNRGKGRVTWLAGCGISPRVFDIRRDYFLFYFVILFFYFLDIIS